MLRIFQTGDNHIGLRYASHEKKEVLAAARIDAFNEMVEAANRELCELFVITGDLFENTYSINKRDIKALLDMLSRFRGTVVVLPGNHDYYDPEAKLWQSFRELSERLDNILLLTEYKPYALELASGKLVLYPAHCTSLHSRSGENKLDWIKKEAIAPDDTYRIGIAHGAVQGETIDSEGRYFLMTREELERIPMDLWLIGHTHVPFPAGLGEQYQACERILNAGTHVQTDVACNTPGLCFIVELNEDKSVRAKQLRTGKLRFIRKHIALRAGAMEETLEHELKSIDDMSVVDLILTGAVHAEEYDRRADVLQRVLSRFIEGTYSDAALSKLISKELIDAEFAETSLSGSLLTALLDEPKEAQLAYELLKSLKEER